MSIFSDLLNSPLPSKSKSFYEEEEFDGYDDMDDNDNVKEEDDMFDGEDVPDNTPNPLSIASDIMDDDDDFDPDDFNDSDLMDLDAELRGDDPEEIGPEEHLSPDEEMQADDMMSVAATTILLDRELGRDEKRNFIESELDTQIAVDEGFMLESDVEEMRESLNDEYDEDIFTEAKISSKTIVKFNKDAKLKQLYGIAVNVSAAARNDRDYQIYKKACRIKKAKANILKKRYHSEAMKRVKVYWKRLMSSKSKVLSSLGKKIKPKGK